VAEGVLDLEGEGERIAGLRMDHVPHDNAIRVAFADGPGRPAHQAVDRVRELRLGERQLEALPVELVAPVLESVRPGDEQLPTTRLRLLVRAVAVEDLLTGNQIGAQSAAHLDDHGALVAEGDLELLTGWQGGRIPRGHAIRSSR
jgi:hypothetical protein